MPHDAQAHLARKLIGQASVRIVDHAVQNVAEASDQELRAEQPPDRWRDR